MSGEVELNGNFDVILNSEETYTCKSEGGSPPARFQWFVGNDNVTNSATQEDGFSTLMYEAKKAYNEKHITCMVQQHKGIGVRNISKQLQVRCR